MTGPRPNIPSHIRSGWDEPQSKEEHTRDSAGLPRVVPVYPPEIYPIPDAQEFNVSGTVATVGVESGTQITLSPQVGSVSGQINLPNGNVGIIRSFLISITNMLTTTNVTFALLVNGAPAGGYGVLSMTPRVAPYVSNGFDTFLRIPDSSKINVVFSNIDGGSYTVGASIGGWFWPSASGIRWVKQGM